MGPVSWPRPQWRCCLQVLAERPRPLQRLRQEVVMVFVSAPPRQPVPSQEMATESVYEASVKHETLWQAPRKFGGRGRRPDRARRLVM